MLIVLLLRSVTPPKFCGHEVPPTMCCTLSDAGVSEMLTCGCVGTGRMTNTNGSDGPPPGGGLFTKMLLSPGAVSRLPGMVAPSDVDEVNVVVSGLLLNETV